VRCDNSLLTVAKFYTSFVWHISETSTWSIRSSDIPSSVVEASITWDGTGSLNRIGDRFYSPTLPFTWTVTSAFAMGGSVFFLAQENSGVFLMECSDLSRNCSSIQKLPGSTPVLYTPSLWAQYDSVTLFFTYPSTVGLEVYRLDISGSSRTLVATNLRQVATVLEDNAFVAAQLNDVSLLYWGAQAGQHDFRVARVSSFNTSMVSVPIDYQTSPTPLRVSVGVKVPTESVRCLQNWCYYAMPNTGHFGLHIPTNKAYQLRTESGTDIGLLEFEKSLSFAHPGLGGILFIGNVTGSLDLFLLDEAVASSTGSGKIPCKGLGFAGTFPLLPYPLEPARSSISGLETIKVTIPSALDSFDESERRTTYLIGTDDGFVDQLQYIYKVNISVTGQISASVFHNESLARAVLTLSPVIGGKIFYFQSAEVNSNLTAVDTTTGQVVSSIDSGYVVGYHQFYLTRNGTLLLAIRSRGAETDFIAVADTLGIHSPLDIIYTFSYSATVSVVGHITATDGKEKMVVCSTGDGVFQTLAFDSRATNWTSNRPVDVFSDVQYGQQVIIGPLCRRFTNDLGQTFVVVLVDQKMFVSDLVQPAVGFYDASIPNNLARSAVFTATESKLFSSASTNFFAFSERVIIRGDDESYQMRWLDSSPCLDDRNCLAPKKCQVLIGGTSRFCVDPSRIQQPISTTTPVPGGTSTPVPCAGTSPLPGAVCQVIASNTPVNPGDQPQQNAVWVFNGALVVGSGPNATVPTLIIPTGTTLVINGPLQITPPASPSTVTMTIAPGSVVEVKGCVSFAGTLQVSLAAQSGQTSVPVINYNGYCGGMETKFDNVSVSAVPPRECATVQPVPQYTARSLSIVLGVDESKCNNGVAGINVPLVAGLVGGIGGAVILALIIAIVVWRKFLKKKDRDEIADIENDKEVAASHAIPLKEVKSDPPKKNKKADETQYSAIAASPHSNMSPSAEATILTIPSDQIKILHKLGEGSYGAVFLGLYEGQFVAVKKLLKSMLSAELDSLCVRMLLHSLFANN
jgi:TM2 domain-containing membrane protein YozV